MGICPQGPLFRPSYLDHGLKRAIQGSTQVTAVDQNGKNFLATVVSQVLPTSRLPVAGRSDERRTTYRNLEISGTSRRVSHTLSRPQTNPPKAASSCWYSMTVLSSKSQYSSRSVRKVIITRRNKILTFSEDGTFLVCPSFLSPMGSCSHLAVFSLLTG